ncbi:MAG: tetratricopeptide repeat protein [Bdellovibrionales bacterium]
MKPKFRIDDNLRYVPLDSKKLALHVENLENKLHTTADVESRVQLLGEIATYLKSLGELDRAENLLMTALDTIEENQLGIQSEIQQKIRLGDVYFYKKAYQLANRIFQEILNTCQNDLDAYVYLDFAHQHAGKNYFEQGEYNQALEHFKKALELRKARQASQEQIDSSSTAINTTLAKLNSNR